MPKISMERSILIRLLNVKVEGRYTLVSASHLAGLEALKNATLSLSAVVPNMLKGPLKSSFLLFNPGSNSTAE
jgi:hypothetical protein